ncbi:helix-turn-helix domain-containing protein [Aliiroseovarius crassostreae]|uniref:helix-turn-helix domain-containing protein n=1 Tax=Aliiroseovarius crassostreae TaxID=154981 RepID=UPI0021AE54A4|nr:helix-turn-helix domain-containing protein [Aliiroseovarius crassostreae]UWQ00299.1 helix-turn-helix domain-containing protein [Aliiroseovarius crassostreae]
MNQISPAALDNETALPAPAAHLTMHRVNIILPARANAASAQMFNDLFSAANDLAPNSVYVVDTHTLTDSPASDPLYWRDRTVLFLGDIRSRWSFSREERGRAQQILRLSGRSVLVGGAIFLLCQSGQASDLPLAIHPNFLAAAEEEGLICGDIGMKYASSGRIDSAISNFAALTLLLKQFAHRHGDYVAGALGDYIGLETGFERSQSKFALKIRQKSGGDRLICAALDTMQADLEHPLAIEELAERHNISSRQLQRRFMDLTGETPLTVYRNLRLERAHQLITLTSMPLREISIATGFGATSNLTRWFRTVYEVTPCALRQSSYTASAA